MGYTTSGSDGGASSFVELTDGPGTIEALKFLRGNAGGTALEFSTSAVTDLRGNSALVDQINGGAGTVGDWSAPFLTIQGAVTACSSGQVVVVLPGTYVEQITMKAGVSVIAWDPKNTIIQHAVAAGAENAVTMAADMVFKGFRLDISASAGADVTGIGWGSAAAHMTSVAEDITIIGTGAGDTFGASFAGVTGVADESHYCMINVNAQLVSEAAARGVVGGGTATTNHAHMKQCSFVVVGTGGVGCEVIGLISALECYFWGTSDGVLNVAPLSNNVLRYTPGTRWNSVSGAGGYTRLAGFEHSLRGNAVFADTTVGDDNTAIISDASRPYATIASALANAVSGDTVYVAPGTYAEALTVPDGVRLEAPGATVTSLVMGSGSSAKVGVVAPGASASGVAVAGGNVALDIDTILLSGNSAVGIAATLTAAVTGYVRRIVETGSPTTTSGITQTGTGTVSLSVDELNADAAYNVGGGCTLNLFVGTLTGTETATGTANVTKAGVKWTGLSDTPGAITALEIVRGNSGGTALEFASVSAAIPQNRANVALVTKTGNDGTGAVGNWALPYLTIQAAVTACAAGQAVFVMPGTYVGALTMKAGVNVIGLSASNCIIEATATNVVTMADNADLVNFMVHLIGTGATFSCVIFTGTTNATSSCTGIEASATGSGTLHAYDLLTPSGTAPTDHMTLDHCKGAGLGITGYGLYHGAGTSNYRSVQIAATGGVGLYVTGGTASLYACTFDGSFAPAITGVCNLNVDRVTEFAGAAPILVTTTVVTRTGKSFGARYFIPEVWREFNLPISASSVVVQPSVNQLTSSWIAPRAAYVTGLQVKLDAAITAGTLTVLAKVGGTTAASVVMTSGTSAFVSVNPFFIPVAAGSLITVVYSTDATFAPANTNVMEAIVEVFE